MFRGQISFMKVLITAPSLDERKNVSGISTLVREIIKADENNFVQFIAGRQDGEKKSVGWLMKQIALPVRFRQSIRDQKPDVIHINTALVPLSILRDASLVFSAKRTKIPTLLHLHGGRFLVEDFSNKFLERVAVKMLKAADKIIVLSEIEKENLTRRFQDLKIEVLPNAVSIKELDTEKNGAGKTIIFLGRLHESKGLNEMIETCKILEKENVDFKFRCFGAGAERDFFVGEMTKILSENFFYGGVISGEEKWSELSKADIFLLPSRYGEGLPIAMLEAMAAKCVPIVADVASVRAVVKNGENGFLVEPYNAAQTADVLKDLLSDKFDWKTLRENARRTIEENYSMGNYVQKLDGIYGEITSK